MENKEEVITFMHTDNSHTNISTLEVMKPAASQEMLNDLTAAIMTYFSETANS